MTYTRIFHLPCPERGCIRDGKVIGDSRSKSRILTIFYAVRQICWQLALVAGSSPTSILNWPIYYVTRVTDRSQFN